jgi:outer membrane PBP1 activator LpoA protein
MKKITPLLLFVLLLTGCATAQKPQEITMFKTPEAKIQYYQEQITRYNYLIEQEKKKLTK